MKNINVQVGSAGPFVNLEKVQYIEVSQNGKEVILMFEGGHKLTVHFSDAQQTRAEFKRLMEIINE